MSGKERMEFSRKQTLINRTRDNIHIMAEYNQLISFVFENYKGRFECIQNPFLHLVSHYLELSYKEMISLALDKQIISLKNDYIHQHDLEELLKTTISICSLLEDTNLTKEHYAKRHTELVNMLKTKVPTYRYAHKLNKKGENIGNAHPFEKDYDSPNIADLFPLFEDCCSMNRYINLNIEAF